MSHITNWTLAWQTAQFIIDNPDQYDQEDWNACFAGHALRHTGHDVYQLVVTDEVAEAACTELGMTFVGAEYMRLFSDSNTLFGLLSELVLMAADDGVEVPSTVLAARAAALATDREAEVMRG